MELACISFAREGQVLHASWLFLQTRTFWTLHWLYRLTAAQSTFNLFRLLVPHRVQWAVSPLGCNIPQYCAYSAQCDILSPLAHISARPE
eukprot:693253-Pleurochrysis_carterae.AAC.1